MTTTSDKRPRSFRRTTDDVVQRFARRPQRRRDAHRPRPARRQCLRCRRRLSGRMARAADCHRSTSTTLPSRRLGPGHLDELIGMSAPDERPRPGGWSTAGQTRAAPSSGLALIIRPIQPKSRSRASTGSNIARAAPPDRRATTTCRPRSLACGRSRAAVSAGSRSHRRPGRSRRRRRSLGIPSTTTVPQLLLGDVGPGIRACNSLTARDTRCQRRGRRRVTPEVFGLDDAEQCRGSRRSRTVRSPRCSCGRSRCRAGAGPTSCRTRPPEDR